MSVSKDHSYLKNLVNASKELMKDAVFHGDTPSLAKFDEALNQAEKFLDQVWTIPAPSELKSITINGETVSVYREVLSYEEIVALAKLPFNEAYSIVHRGDKGRIAETVYPRKVVRIYPDSKFTVVLTNNA